MVNGYDRRLSDRLFPGSLISANRNPGLSQVWVLYNYLWSSPRRVMLVTGFHFLILQSVRRDQVWRHSGEILSFYDTRLVGLFQRIFGPGPMDNFQKSLACQRYRRTIPVWDKLMRNSSSCLPTCTRCGQNNETVLLAIVQCPRIMEMWGYVEYLLWCLGSVQLSSETSSTTLNREDRLCLLYVVATAKEVVWKYVWMGWQRHLPLQSRNPCIVPVHVASVWAIKNIKCHLTYHFAPKSQLFPWDTFRNFRSFIFSIGCFSPCVIDYRDILIASNCNLVFILFIFMETNILFLPRFAFYVDNRFFSRIFSFNFFCFTHQCEILHPIFPHPKHFRFLIGEFLLKCISPHDLNLDCCVFFFFSYPYRSTCMYIWIIYFHIFPSQVFSHCL